MDRFVAMSMIRSGVVTGGAGSSVRSVECRCHVIRSLGTEAAVLAQAGQVEVCVVFVIFIEYNNGNKSNFGRTISFSQFLSNLIFRTDS